MHPLRARAAGRAHRAWLWSVRRRISQVSQLARLSKETFNTYEQLAKANIYQPVRRWVPWAWVSNMYLRDCGIQVIYYIYLIHYIVLVPR